jgi:FixJ family two-component response regulator
MSTTCGSVIIVEDDAAVRKALKFVLEVEGMSVRLHTGAAELLAEAACLPPHGCLVIDYHMPGTDGVELLRALRDQKVLLPALLITGKATAALRARARAAGFCCVLEKPLAGSGLTDSIRTALLSTPAHLPDEACRDLRDIP